MSDLVSSDPDDALGDDAPSARKRRRWRKLGGVRYLPSGRAQVRVRGCTPDGVPFALEQTVEAKLAEATLAKFRELGERYRAGLAIPEQSITLAEWLKTYLAKRTVSAEQKRWTSEQAATWKLLRRLHRLPLQALVADTIAAWVASVIYRGRGQAPRGSGKASPAYIRHAFELLNRVVQAAIAAHVLARCPWGNKRPACIPTYAKARRKRRPFESEEMAALLAAARDSSEESLHLRLWTQMQTGVRPHELARAQVSWLVPVQSMPGMPQVPGAGVLRLPEAKKGDAHAVPIDARLFSALRAHIDALAPAARACGFIFPVFHKRRWRARKRFIAASVFDDLRARAGLDHVEDSHGRKLVAYQARHTRLSDVANDPRMGTRAAQAIAGHASDSTIIHDYLGNVHRAVPAAAFEPSTTLRGALQDDGDDPDPSPPSKPRGARKSGNRLHVRGTHVNAPKVHRRDRAALSGAETTRAPGHAVRIQLSVPAERDPRSLDTARAHNEAPVSSRTCEPRRESNQERVPNACPPRTMPAESEVFTVALCVRRDGVDVSASKVIASLGPADAQAWARELIEESDGCDALAADEREALRALAEAIRADARLHVVPAVPSSHVSRAVADGCGTNHSRFTRKIPS